MRESIFLHKSNIDFRGFTKEQFNSYESALKFFNQAININSNYIEAYFQRGLLQKKVFKYEEAIDNFTKVLEINPQFIEALFTRGECKIELFDSDENDYFIHEANTKTIEEMRSWGDPLQDCNKAIEIDPNNADFYQRRGCWKQELEDYQGAIDDYKKAIEINPSLYLSSKYFYKRGRIRIKSFDYKNALNDFSKAIELSPNYLLAYVWRGCANDNLGREIEALKDFKKALELEPNEEKSKGILRVIERIKGKNKNEDQ